MNGSSLTSIYLHNLKPPVPLRYRALSTEHCMCLVGVLSLSVLCCVVLCCVVSCRPTYMWCVQSVHSFNNFIHRLLLMSYGKLIDA